LTKILKNILNRSEKAIGKAAHTGKILLWLAADVQIENGQFAD
jgi:hypothetical protein